MFSREAGTSPEVWAGLECTINRTRDGYRDQTALSGHDGRALDDLAAFERLGIRRIRYPVLWEKTAPRSPVEVNFDQSDARLDVLRSSGIAPIVGLLHHGSGPEYTSLVDPDFPQRLADYARRVAERYPWVDAYTPVNEPLTTARFSGLYGIWYPHGHDDRTFARALHNQVKGTVLAMRAIREVNPAAFLLQTEDLGRTTGTPRVRRQVEFENARRWLSLDLLLGNITPGHALYTYLHVEGGLGEDELSWFEDNPCPPDIIGVNHYPLSNRFLDHRRDLYPAWLHGGNGRQRYADVGAVDSGRADPPMPECVLRDVWQRYRMPFAVTEAHITGPREEQMRWLDELWTASVRLRNEGAPLVAVTAWSLLGSFDWATLCTSADPGAGYESGVFDARWSPAPQPTALAAMIRSLAETGSYRHPLLERAGYWRQPSRVRFAPAALPPPSAPPTGASRPILILGEGQLGRAFSHACELRNIDRLLLPEPSTPTRARIEELLDEINPWAVIESSLCAYADEGGVDAERCGLRNVVLSQNLAELCLRRNIRLLALSSGIVFDGAARKPYPESHPVSPLSPHGAVRVEAERRVSDANPEALIARPGAFFAPGGWDGLLNVALRNLQLGEDVQASDQVTISPTYVPDFVSVCLDLLADEATGLIHLSNQGFLSWADWARHVAALVGASSSRVVTSAHDRAGLSVPGRRNRALSSERADLLPSFDDALERFGRAMLRKA
jgi:dTDP-4-dehydrorhamnose reductase